MFNVMTNNRMLNILPNTTAYAQFFASYMASLVAKTDKESELHNKIKLYREYVAGDQAAPLNEYEQALLGDGVTYQFNVCRTILNVKNDRLKVMQLILKDALDAVASTDENGNDIMLGDLLTEQFKRQWDKNRMDLRQRHNHWNASRDGESFIIADYDHDKKQVVFIPNERWAGTTGVRAIYSEENPTEVSRYVKHWVESYVDKFGYTAKRVRMNVYYPDRVEKWYQSGGWKPYEFDGTPVYDLEQGYKAAVVWWTHDFSPSGLPLGFPVFHFICNADGGQGGVSDLADIVPHAQDDINRKGASLLAGTSVAGFGITYMFGAKLPGDENDMVQMFPGTVIDGLDKEGSITQTQPADLPQLIQSLETSIRHAAMLANIPLSYINTTGQVMAEGTQQQNEVALTSVIKQRQVAFGNAYEDLAKLTVKLLLVNNQLSDLVGLLGGSTDRALQAIDDLSVECDWLPAEMRDETAEVNRVAVKVEKLGLPQEMGLEELGYSQADLLRIEKYNNDKLIRSTIAAMQFQQSQVEAQATTNERQPADTAGADDQQGQAAETDTAIATAA